MVYKAHWHKSHVGIALFFFHVKELTSKFWNFSIFCPCMEHAQAIMALQAAYFEMGMYE